MRDTHTSTFADSGTVLFNILGDANSCSGKETTDQTNLLENLDRIAALTQRTTLYFTVDI